MLIQQELHSSPTPFFYIREDDLIDREDNRSGQALSFQFLNPWAWNAIFSSGYSEDMQCIHWCMATMQYMYACCYKTTLSVLLGVAYSAGSVCTAAHNPQFDL